MSIDQSGECFGKPPASAALTDFPVFSSSRMRSKINTLLSTAMPIVKTTPAIPGMVNTAPKHECRQKQQSVQSQREDRIRTSPAVIKQHGSHNRYQTSSTNFRAAMHRIGTRSSTVRSCINSIEAGAHYERSLTARSSAS